MSSENEFLVEFPAERDYIPFMQTFLKEFLNNYDFSKKFSENAVAESLSWFNTVIPEEKLLQALPTVSFAGKTSQQGLQVQIQTTDEKLFTINLPNTGDAK
jgi:hypothetical protein